jgi:hypothetical protein
VTRRLRRGESGSALVASLVLVAVAFTVTSIVTLRATLDSQRIVRHERQLLALNAAEAGLAETLQDLRMDPWVNDEHGGIGRGTWSVKVEHDVTMADFQVATLDAEATVVDQTRHLRMRVRIWPTISADIPAPIRLIDWTARP